MGTSPGARLERHPVARVVELEDARDDVRPFGQALARNLGDQQVAVAREGLHRRVVDQLLVADEDVRVGELERSRQRDRDAQLSSVSSKRAGLSSSGGTAARQRSKRVSRGAARLRQPQRQRRAFGHADLVGADQPVALDLDRRDVRRRRRFAGTSIGTSTAYSPS